MIRRAWRTAWLASVRQPGRTVLGVLGIVAIGALLFDMLLLSRGLVVSFGDLLDRVGFDVRVLATNSRPLTGPSIADGQTIAARIAALPEVEAVLRVKVRQVVVATSPPEAGADRPTIQFIGTSPPGRSIWTLLEGTDPTAGAAGTRSLVVNRHLAHRLGAAVGSTIDLVCSDTSTMLPALTFTIAGVAEFPFDDASGDTTAGPLDVLQPLCGEAPNDADMLMVRSRQAAGAPAAAAAIRHIGLPLYVVTNQDLLERFSRVEFSYFRQISAVLGTITLFFGFLLIAVLLTVSVNQRFAQIAALRALGLTRTRVVAGVLFESMVMVGAGAILAVPVGWMLSLWLDRILRRLPGIPLGVHFFVFEPRVLLTYGWLLGAAAVGAAIYPMFAVARLPIASTLRREVVS